jgi:hypothetical protein
MLKRKYLLLTVLLLTLSLTTLGQDTSKRPIVPLDTGIAKKVVKDLERYDLCVIERRSLLNETSILKDKLIKKDSLLKFRKQINTDLKAAIDQKNKQLEIYKKRINEAKRERNIAIGTGILGLALVILIGS